MALKGLIAWAALGILGLVFQATWFFKDEWAAKNPSWRPALELFCRVAACQLAPLRVADAVLIDHASVDLIPEPIGPTGDGITTETSIQASAQWRFQVTLRNAQTIEVATPWIELSLTDSQDQAVMRQVFNPMTFGAPQVLKPAEIWTQDLRLHLANDQIEFMGYRLLTFYP